jgi:4-amino-4-deoxy-L-arabinose transferase-like glycosyltransferase
MKLQLNKQQLAVGTLFAKLFPWLLIAGILVNASGLFITILEPDAALYAGLAKSMALSNDFINLKDLGSDWLDKPHFPFWITAFSFKIFGISSFTYRLPAFIFWLIGLWYTWKFAILFYKQDTAKLAVLIYISSFHLVISNSDVRAEPFLTGLIIASVYHFYKTSVNGSLKHLIAGSLLAALAVMTKGLFVLITIGAGLFFHWLYTGNFRQQLHYRWLVAAFLIFIFILPELYCLYVQFDLHPEKSVFERTGVSGIRFFIWDSQFGRFFNTGPIKGKGDPFFYIHTMLWAFLPWTLFLFGSFVWRLKRFKNSALVNVEYISLFSVLVTFIVFSLSKFQLPHYTNILFPFFAVSSAHWILSVAIKSSVFRIVQQISVILAVAGVLIVLYVSAFKYWQLCFLFLAGSVMMLFYFLRSIDPGVIVRSFLSICCVCVVLNGFIYPSLFQYQSGSNAAAFLNNIHSAQTVYVFEIRSYSFEFYTKQPVSFLNRSQLDFFPRNKTITVFTAVSHLSKLESEYFTIKIKREFFHFPISRLTKEFIIPESRAASLQKFVLAEITRL